MPKFKLCVTQVLRVERDCVVEVEADTLAAAIALQQESDAPAYADKCWTDYVDLQNEVVSEYVPATRQKPA